MGENVLESWNLSRAYEHYVGRWSRKVAVEFVRWLALPDGLAWADVGCGTGALTSAILSFGQPVALWGIDTSETFVSLARQQLPDSRICFEVGDAAHLPWTANTFDATVSGLVLNFVPDYRVMVREMARVAKRTGTVAAYVWDYADGMKMMRLFWDAAKSVSPNDAKLDQAERFPICQPEPLRALFIDAGLKDVGVHAIEITTPFQNFNDYWEPFLGRTGAAPAYLASVTDDFREKIRLTLMARLSISEDEPFELTARAWAVRGMV